MVLGPPKSGDTSVSSRVGQGPATPLQRSPCCAPHLICPRAHARPAALCQPIAACTPVAAFKEHTAMYPPWEPTRLISLRSQRVKLARVLACFQQLSHIRSWLLVHGLALFFLVPHEDALVHTAPNSFCSTILALPGDQTLPKSTARHSLGWGTCDPICFICCWSGAQMWP